MKLRSGDLVKVITGKDAGKEAKIARIIPKKNRVIVEGVATDRRHERPRGQTMQGGIVDKDMPIDASNVMIICSKCGPTRIGARINDDGTKVRICVKCDGEL